MTYDDWARFDTVLQEAPHGGRFAEVGDSGWHMLLCWEAGPSRVVRVADALDHHVVELSDHHGGSSLVPRTSGDQAIIEEGVNEYLAEADVPARPAGFAWYLLVPPGCGLADLVADVFERETACNSLRPRDTALCMRTAVDRFYAGS